MRSCLSSTPLARASDFTQGQLLTPSLLYLMPLKLPCFPVSEFSPSWGCETCSHSSIAVLVRGLLCLDCCPIPELDGWDVGAQDVISRVTCALFLHLKYRNVEQDLWVAGPKPCSSFQVSHQQLAVWICSLNAELWQWEWPWTWKIPKAHKLWVLKPMGA